MAKKKTLAKHPRAEIPSPPSPIDTSEPRVEPTVEIHHGEVGSNHPDQVEPSMHGDYEEAAPSGMEIAMQAPQLAKYRPNIRMGREKRSKRFHDPAASSSTAAVRDSELDADEAQVDPLGDEAPLPDVRARQSRRGRKRNDEGDEVLDSGGEPARIEESSDEEVIGWREVPEEYRDLPDTPLLSGLSSHLSVYARPNPGEPSIYSGFRGAWQKAYDLYSTASEDIRDQLSAFGFGYFITIRPFRSDRKWMLALCERWFDKTNTFHFPCCEMGITPTDFVMLTGIRFGGTPLRLRRTSKARILDLMGIPLKDRIALDKRIFDRGLKVRVVWLKESLMDAHLDLLSVDEPEFPFVIRRLLLYIFGQCFFPEDRSSVDGRYLQWMDPLDEIGAYDWGSTIYAIILRGLRRVTRLRRHSCRFFSPLLELWAREYLAPFRPHITGPAIRSYYPRSHRWELPSAETKKHLLHKAREELDHLDLSGTEGRLHVPVDPPSPMALRLSVRKCVRQMRQKGLPASDFLVLGKDYASWYKEMSIGYLLKPIAVRVGATDIGGKAVEAFRTGHQLRSIMASCSICHGASSAVPSFVGRTDLGADVSGPSSSSLPARGGSPDDADEDMESYEGEDFDEGDEDDGDSDGSEDGDDGDDDED
ncbi:hypothetical protein HHK36_013344 [Tetracentron sinense]|uniref:Aminotransferase-like plant mobile domain-containing protein n=1 Tax=Tetracentron sinense TaxID=13715 RepID=A0A834Z7I2_TETSI|nr:hypothetical protein HHK36_013344 [Tetracentron sinense]